MQLNKLNNIVFLKNVESNFIEEAFIVLKQNVKMNKVSKNFNIKEEKKQYKIDILNEAELLINKEIEKNNIKYEKIKLIKLERKLKISRFLNFLLLVIYFFLIFI